ncbi:GntR family transcriptional regulator [Cryobacterium roopkundense]|nr:GntR family transcriptional regulator [Cryobacterium roopkundense]
MSQQPLSKQIAAQLRAGVTSGDIVAGERLPPAREFAAALGVNMHTVVRAYAALRDDGLLEMRQGRGARITATAGQSTVRLAELAREIVDVADTAGISRTELLRIIERI